MTQASIFVGFDPREAAAFAVARYSIKRHLTQPIPIYGVVLDELRRLGLYRRCHEIRHGPLGTRQMWDTISDAPMATEFAISRFLVPIIVKQWISSPLPQWALFMDCDVLVRCNLVRLFDEADSRYAVMCVKHDHQPDLKVKMDGQIQTSYPRKNWSSVMLWNVRHHANDRLTLDMINTLRGRDLHGLCWLDDDEIGGLDQRWNWLAGHSSDNVDPAIVHFTEGWPGLRGHEDQPYADEWRRTLSEWAV